jgi:hypothetical protein
MKTSLIRHAPPAHVLEVCTWWGDVVVDVRSIRAGEVAVVAGRAIKNTDVVDGAASQRATNALTGASADEGFLDAGPLRLELRRRQGLPAAAAMSTVDTRAAKIMAMAMMTCVGLLTAAFLTPPTHGVEDDLVRSAMAENAIPMIRAVRPPPTTPPATPKKAPRRLPPDNRKTASAMTAKARTSKAAKHANDVAMATSALQTLGLGVGSVGAKLELDLGLALQNLRSIPAGVDGAVAGVGVRSVGGGVNGVAVGIGALGSGGVLGVENGGNVNLTGRGHKAGRVVGGKTGPVQGGLERGEIQRVINKAMSQIRYCYERELGAAPTLEGRLLMAWTIGATGYVSSVSAVDDGVGKDVGACVSRVLQRLRFPSPRGGGVVNVSYPFLFSVAGD